MKTIHIYDTHNLQKLIVDLYKRFLFKDNSFHYFYEPALIIRSSNRKVIKEISDYLHKKHYLYEVYDYPLVKEKRHFGDPAKSITVKYLKHFMKTYHATCVFYLNCKPKDYLEIRAKLIHGLYNINHNSYLEEAQALNNMGMRRMYQIGKMGLEN